MELRHLRYFVTVVEEQSLTKAAEKLFIAQPPLTRQIKKFRRRIRDRFIRKRLSSIKSNRSRAVFLPACGANFDAHRSSCFDG